MRPDLFSRGFVGYVTLELMVVAMSALFAAFLCLLKDQFPFYYAMWGWCFIVMQVQIGFIAAGRLLKRRR